MAEKKVQLYPAKVRVVPNCKLAKITANLTEQKFQKMLDGNNRQIVEKKKHKKKGKTSSEIVSTYQIINADGYDGTDPLTFFDYSVLSVIDSAQLEGGDCITFAMILRGLTGKTTANGNGNLHPDQRAAIFASVLKLMQTIIKIDNSQANKELGYEGAKIIHRQILSAHIETTKINGQVVEDVVCFHRDENGKTIKSPIFEVADQRNQIIRYDTALLDVPNQNNTPLVITLKNYVMLRVMEIKKHKMTPTITLDDIFKKCRITRNTEKTRQIKETIDKFFAHLQAKGVVDSFSWKKQGTKIHGVEFTFKKTASN